VRDVVTRQTTLDDMGISMSERSSIETAKAFLDSHLTADGQPVTVRPRAKQQPAITISRESGAGGLSVAEMLAEHLERHRPSPGAPWTVFDKRLVEIVLEKLNLPSRLASSLPEDKVSGITDAVEELLGLHPPAWTLVRQLSETILQLATLGNAIFVGRGAIVVTAGLAHVFNVRLVGSLARRIERIMDRYNLSHKAAADFIATEDKGRRRYLKKHFGKDIDDPLLYHLTINTDQVTCSDAANLIGRYVLEHYY
jgi:cytidylate kinase